MTQVEFLKKVKNLYPDSVYIDATDSINVCMSILGNKIDGSYVVRTENIDYKSVQILREGHQLIAKNSSSWNKLFKEVKNG